MTNHDEQMKAVARLVSGRPDWVDAPAVQAWHRSDGRTEHDGTPGKPRIWSPDYRTTERWSTPSLRNVHWSDLVDVVPLAAPAGSDTRPDTVHRADGWKAAVRLAEDRDEARAMAARWKEATRREVRKVHDEDDTIEALRGVVNEAVEDCRKYRRERDGARARAEKAEAERDEARRHECSDLDAHWRLDETLASLKEANATVASLRAEQPHPLTPDDITDEMVRRGAQAATPAGARYLRPHEVLEVLTAALTEPPRPEGAEELEAAMSDLEMDDPAGFADLLAERGVRVASVGLTPTNPEEQNR